VLPGRTPIQAIGQLAPGVHPAPGGSTFMGIANSSTSCRILSCHSCLIGLRSTSVNRPKAKTHGSTYDNPVPGGYTAHHAAFNHDIEFWQQKASNPRVAKAATSTTSKPIQDRVAIKVLMGRILPGQKKITMIGVRIDRST
jgi:hypothetical protein